MQVARNTCSGGGLADAALVIDDRDDVHLDCSAVSAPVASPPILHKAQNAINGG